MNGERGPAPKTDAACPAYLPGGQQRPRRCPFIFARTQELNESKVSARLLARSVNQLGGTALTENVEEASHDIAWRETTSPSLLVGPTRPRCPKRKRHHLPRLYIGVVIIYVGIARDILRTAPALTPPPAIALAQLQTNTKRLRLRTWRRQ
jgi:hypothetical protein